MPGRRSKDTFRRSFEDREADECELTFGRDGVRIPDECELKLMDCLLTTGVCITGSSISTSLILGLDLVLDFEFVLPV